MIFIFGISISLFLVFLLLLKKKKCAADKVLLSWFIVLTVHQALHYLEYSGHLLEYGFLVGVAIPFPLLHGPFLFIYTSLLVNSQSLQKRYYWIHFVPFVLMHLYLVHFYRLPLAEKIYVLENEGVGYELFLKINLTLIITSGLGYIFGNLFLIWRHQKRIKKEFSNIDKINLKWLQYLIYGLLVIWVIVFFGEDNHIFSGVTFFILLIGVFGIQQGHIFSNNALPKTNDFSGHFEEEYKSNRLNTNIRYGKSGLTEEKRVTIRADLMKLMENEKLFLDSELSLTFLASKLNAQPNYVSQCINEEFGISFYEFVNSKRVDEFKHRIALPEYEKYKLMEVAYDCGFNSKSTFNRVFKKANDLTPTEYLKTIGQERLSS